MCSTVSVTWVHGEHSRDLPTAPKLEPEYVRSLVAIVLDIQANRTGITFFRHENPSLSLNYFQGCRVPRSTTSFKVSLPHRPPRPSPPFSLSRVLSKLSTLPPMVTPSEVSLIERKLHGSPHRLIPSFVQDRTSTPSARPRSTQRGLFASCW
jgi:hypothetical protein